MLREFSLRGRGDGDVGAKHNRARGCGALIDGQHKGHERCFPEGVFVFAAAPGKRIGAAQVNMETPCASLTLPWRGRVAHATSAKRA